MEGNDRVAGMWRWLEKHVANPVLRTVLRSPLHVVASDRLLLLSYEGRISGERFTTPVAYERDDREFVVTTFREPVAWWRNFRAGHPGTLWVRGQAIGVEGRAVTDTDEIADWLEELARRRRTRILDFFGVCADASRDEFEGAAESVVIVRFARRSGAYRAGAEVSSSERHTE
jgi:hypothetical protein